MLLVDGSLTRAAGTGSPPGTPGPISEPWSWASTSPRRCSPTQKRTQDDSPLGITYICCDASATERWDGQAFRRGVVQHGAHGHRRPGRSTLCRSRSPAHWRLTKSFHFPPVLSRRTGGLVQRSSQAVSRSRLFAGGLVEHARRWRSWTSRRQSPHVVDLSQQHHPVGLQHRGVCRTRRFRPGNSGRAGTATVISGTDPAI